MRAMSRALSLVVPLLLCACSGASSPAGAGSTTPEAPPASSQAEAAATSPAEAPAPQPAAAPMPGTASTSAPAADSAGAITRPSPVATPAYSCFSYVAVNTTKKRHSCMRTADCPSYLEQVQALKGIRELTGCASMSAVWCFHQLAKDEPDGVEVCQPTLDDCTAARTAAVKAKQSVDTPCTQR
jgi:hypothetical protein